MTRDEASGGPTAPARADQIVVGVDGTAFGLGAARWAAAEAARRRWSVRLICVRREDVMGDGAVPDSAAARAALADAEFAVREVSAGVPLVAQHRVGHVPTVLFEESRQAGAVVVGSRGMARPIEALPDSTVLIVAMHAHCPVIVVPGETVPRELVTTGPVVVGVDGSPVSDPALGYAVDAAAVRGTGLVAVHSWSGAEGVTRADAGDVPVEQQHAEQVLAERLAGWSQRYPEVPVRRVVTPERPVPRLLTEAARAQLLVVGSRGRGGFDGMLLGSTSQALLYGSTRPIAVVRSRESAQPRPES